MWRVASDGRRCSVKSLHVIRSSLIGGTLRKQEMTIIRLGESVPRRFVDHQIAASRHDRSLERFNGVEHLSDFRGAVCIQRLDAARAEAAGHVLSDACNFGIPFD
jgi:hypothetical protein